MCVCVWLCVCGCVCVVECGVGVVVCVWLSVCGVCGCVCVVECVCVCVAVCVWLRCLLRQQALVEPNQDAGGRACTGPHDPAPRRAGPTSPNPQ